jgi:hypothetical protein
MVMASLLRLDSAAAREPTWATHTGTSKLGVLTRSHCLWRPAREAGADCTAASAGSAVGRSYRFLFAGKTST